MGKFTGVGVAFVGRMKSGGSKNRLAFEKGGGY